MSRSASQVPLASSTPSTPLLFIDLNNFAAYPTLAVAYLIRSLRLNNIPVKLLSPLSLGVPAFTRDHQENWKDQLFRRIYFSSSPVLRHLHDYLRNIHSRWQSRPHPLML